MKTLFNYFILIMALGISSNIKAQYQTIANGNWHSSSTWLNGNIPPATIIPAIQAIDSITIKHDVLFDNNQEELYFVKNKFSINQGAKLTITSLDTFLTAQPSPSDTPTFIVNGELKIQNRAAFQTNIGSATYQRVFFNNTVIVESSSFCWIISHKEFKNIGQVSMLDSNDFRIVVEDRGNAFQYGDITIGSGNYFILSTNDGDVQNKATISSINDNQISISSGNTGNIINYKKVLSSGTNTMIDLIAEKGSVYNYDLINSPLGPITIVINNKLNSNDGLINSTSGVIQGSTVTITTGNDTTQISKNDGAIIGGTITLDHTYFQGFGNFCAQSMITVSESSITGNLDLCSTNFGSFGIINVSSYIASSITNCQKGICTYTGVNENTVTTEVNVYPNPANEFIKIESLNKIHSISIYNSYGQEVLYNEINSTFKQIGLGELSPGIYLYKIKTEFGYNSGRIVVQ